MAPNDVLVVFSTSNHLLSKIIRFFTKSQVSHCSVWFTLFGVPLVLQASVGGVKPALLSEWMKHNKVVQKLKLRIDVTAGLTEALGLLNAGYDYVGLFGYFYVLVGRWLSKKVKNPLASPTRVVCSEFVLRLDAKDQIPEWNDLEWESTDPQLLMENCGASFETAVELVPALTP